MPNKKCILPIPVGNNILIKLDNEDEAKSGIIIAIGRGVSNDIVGNRDSRYGCRGIEVGDRVVFGDSLKYHEIAPNTDDPERPTYCVIDISDVLFIDNDYFDGKYST